MSLRFILGNSGSGKSYYLYQHLIEAAVRSPEKKFLVIVPEQFTMQTQRELVRLHPDGGLLNIDILSFPRLAHRVFEEVGADGRAVLEETGKIMLLRRAASKKQDELKVLRGDLKRMGYLQQLKSMISELTQYDIDPEKMERLLESARPKPSLYYKLQDLNLLYESFQEELGEKYITAEETLEALCQVADRSSLLCGSVIAMDGFTGFTPIQQKLLLELFRLAEQVLVTVTIDARVDLTRIYGEHELFYLSKKTIRMLARTAREAGCELLPPVTMEGKALPRFRKSPGMAFLERRLFRGGSRTGWEQMTAREAAEISLHVAATPACEAHFAARTIRGLLKEGYRYQDIAVIVGDLASYSYAVPQIFREYAIPCFMDSTRNVFSNPLVEWIRAALDMVQQNFTATSVFRYLRTTLCRLERDSLDMLENYVLAEGIRGLGQWEKPFIRQPKSMTAEQFEQVQQLRAQIVAPLLSFAGCMRSGQTTVAQKATALYDLLCYYEIQQQMAAWEEDFRRQEQVELQKEFAGIYATVIALFDKLVELLGDECLGLKEYTELLEAGFEEARVRLIPPSADCVQVGDLERTRLQNVKVLLFLGLNDGWVPSLGSGGGLLSDLERENLQSSGVELAPTARENSYIQRFYLYLHLTKPSERLYLSCCRTSADGVSLRPSYVLRTVQRLFPGLEFQDEDVFTTFTPRVFTPQNGYAYLLEGFQKIRQEYPSAEWLNLYNWYRREGTGRETVEKLVRAAFLTFDESGIGRAAAEELYGRILVNSVSRLEKFASCAFAHFLQYGLRLQEREEYTFQAVDMGRVFHSALENYSRRVEQSGYDWFHMPAKIRDALIDACVDEVTEDYGQRILHDSARYEWMITRMKQILRRSVWALHQQIAHGQFLPSAFEVSFSQVEDLEAVNIALSGEEKMKLQGRIDRIDVCERENQVYVKVVDYKSGGTSFDLVALYHGLQLQLVVYLNAALELEQRIHPDREIVPAGVLYYHVKDPLLNTEQELTPEELNRKLLRELRPDGLVNGESDVLRALDVNLEKASDVIPVTINRDGSPSRLSKVARPEQFAQLSAFVHRKLQELGRQMMEGEIAPLPYQRKQQSACDFCLYRAVCGLDKKVPGTRMRRLQEYTSGEIWEKICTP